MISFSPGGRRGATCGNATSGGVSTTFLRARRSPPRSRSASRNAKSEPATTPRWWRHSSRELGEYMKLEQIGRLVTGELGQREQEPVRGGYVVAGCCILEIEIVVG